MFKSLKKFIVDSFNEGYEEARLESEEENRVEKELMQSLFKKNPSIENLAIAMSCPFREIFVLGEDSRLFYFNRISDSERESVKKLLKRDFQVTDEDSMWFALENLKGANSTFTAMTSLYLITSSIEVGFISFSDYQELCKGYIQEVISKNDLLSWYDVSLAFKAGDSINNIIGKKIIEKSIDKLLTYEQSPWTVYTWEEIKASFETFMT